MGHIICFVLFSMTVLHNVIIFQGKICTVAHTLKKSLLSAVSRRHAKKHKKFFVEAKLPLGVPLPS